MASTRSWAASRRPSPTAGTGEPWRSAAITAASSSATLAESGSVVYTAAFQPGGNLLATGNWLGDVHLWDARTGTPVRRLDHRHRGAAYRVVFHPSRPLLAIASERGGGLLVDPRDG